MRTAARWEEERGSQGNKSFCRLHSEPDGSVGPLVGGLEVSSPAFNFILLGNSMEKYRIPTKEISPATFTILMLRD